MSDNNTYYVQARTDELGIFASCRYFSDYAATQPVETPLWVPPDAGSCLIAQAEGSELALIGSVFKTLGQAPSLNISNYCPASDDGLVTVSMPTTSTVTKGVVLLFSDPQTVTMIYPSKDPQIINTPP
ncbi:hypothetical protein [Pelomonas sp. KK5]|uniref:hypothetical protein n=1 Tax=Pelomonas sp. KK5 TaxID=1855730 RepID=UPI00097C54E1|nr:hypothetical protein [Pelomonas sp. KK5]